MERNVVGLTVVCITVANCLRIFDSNKSVKIYYFDFNITKGALYDNDYIFLESFYLKTISAR